MGLIRNLLRVAFRRLRWQPVWRRRQAWPRAKYPDHPVKVVVGFSAGGGTDVAARVIAQKLTEATGRPSWWRTGPAPAD